MGASYPDLNRCIYKFADDRRCRSVIAGPGLPHCRPHQKLVARRVAAAERRAGRPAAPSHTARDAFIEWLGRHALDNFTNVNRALNQVTLLLAAGVMLPQEARPIIAVLTSAQKHMDDMRAEFNFPARRSHCPAGEQFAAELRETLLPAIQVDQDAQDAAQEIAAPHDPILELNPPEDAYYTPPPTNSAEAAA